MVLKLCYRAVVPSEYNGHYISRYGMPVGTKIIYYYLCRDRDGLNNACSHVMECIIITVCMALLVYVLCQPVVHSCIEPSLHQLQLDFF